jgi:transposase InsO family protein
VHAAGLVTHYVLFFLDLASRTVKIAGVTTHPNDLWMTQVARNLTDPEEEFLRSIRFLIMDRDTKYCDAFRSILVREGIEVIRLPPRTPNLNAFAERFVRSVKAECLDCMIFFGRSSLQRALTEYLRTIIASAIIRAWLTACCRAPLSRARQLGQSCATSGLEECSASTIARLHKPTGRSDHVSGQYAVRVQYRNSPRVHMESIRIDPAGNDCCSSCGGTDYHRGYRGAVSLHDSA